MSRILIDASLLLIVPSIVGVAYALKFNARFNLWREGRKAWREMARFRKRHAPVTY